MTIHKDEEWIQIAEIDEHDQIRFTSEYRQIMGELGWEAKAFAGWLLAIWYDPFEHMLDYTSGEAEHTADQPGEYDQNGLGDPQDVVEYWAVYWSQNDNHHQPPQHAGCGLELGVEWYRDVLRAKLVSIRLPRRLVIQYRDRSLEEMKRWEAELEQGGTLRRMADLKKRLSEQPTQEKL